MHVQSQREKYNAGSHLIHKMVSNVLVAVNYGNRKQNSLKAITEQWEEVYCCCKSFVMHFKIRIIPKINI